MRCHNTQIIPDQIHNRSMFRRFFPVRFPALPEADGFFTRSKTRREEA